MRNSLHVRNHLPVFMQYIQLHINNSLISAILLRNLAKYRLGATYIKLAIKVYKQQYVVFANFERSVIMRYADRTRRALRNRFGFGRISA